MRKLHERLVGGSGAYAGWHNHSAHGVVHWAVLVIIATALSTNVLVDAATTGLSLESATARGIAGKSAAAPAKAKLAEAAEDRILVRFKDSVGAAKRAEVLAKHGLSEKSEIEKVGIKIISVKEGDTPEEAIDRLKAQDPESIEFAEPDMLRAPDLVPNDPSYSSQWEKTKTNAPAAWDVTTGEGVVIGIADSGVNCAHPDLSCVPGWNFYSNNNDASDVHGHGTRVAGTAAAVGNNATGVAGQAFSAKVMPLRVSDAGGYAYDSTIAKAVTWAADNGAKVVNNSYQTSDSSTVQQAGRYLKGKGGLLVVSEGNYSNDAGTAASADLISVSATDPNDARYSWSSYGNDVDVSAPGCVTTTSGSSYSGACGTSFSAPMAAGTLALIFAANPSLSPNQAQNALFTSAKDIGDAGWDTYYGWGRIDAGAAVALARSTSSAADTVAPSAPSNVKATAVDSSKVSVTWSASTDNIGVAGYRVYRDGAQIGSVAGTSYSDAGVLPLTPYSYSVRSYDESGNVSVMSASTTVTTPALAVRITSYQVAQKSGSTAVVTWTTNMPSTGKVSFGLSSGSLTGSASDASASTAHSVTLTGLKPNTKYFYKIDASSQDGSSAASSPTSTFRTSRK